MTLAHAARTWVRGSLGLDVQRYPMSDPLYGLSLLLGHLATDLVVDVGANDGGYARSLRRLGYRGQIVSFEPLAGPFARLSAAAARDDAWDVSRCALGDRQGEIVVHVAGNAGASSSVLPMLDAHLAAAPGAAYVTDETVPVHRLDEILPDLVSLTGRRCFLKMDVQGFERAVLDGATGLLAGGGVLGIQAEMSLVPLYDGSMLWRETVDRMASEGFELASLVPGFSDPTSGRLLQADGVFVREGVLADERTP
jgi:FkbM family methyltransferase